MTNPGPIVPLRPRAPQPDGLTVVEDEQEATEGEYRRAPGVRGRLVIRRSWFSKSLFFMVPFCLIWDGFMVNWYATLMSGSGSRQGPGLLFYLFPLLHVGVGVWLTYRTVTGFVNRTWITVADGAVTVRHGPLPWPGSRTLAAADIEQLYCEQAVTQTKSGSSSSFNLSAMLRDGRKVELLRGLPGADQALFLEQRIEERLGIPDGRVAGEFRG